MPREDWEGEYCKGFLWGKTDTEGALWGAYARKLMEEGNKRDQEARDREFRRQFGSSGGSAATGDASGLVALLAFGAGAWAASAGYIPWTTHPLWGGVSGMAAVMVIAAMIEYIPGAGLVFGTVFVGLTVGWLAPEWISNELRTAPLKERLGTGVAAAAIVGVALFVVGAVLSFVFRLLARLLGPVFRFLTKVVKWMVWVALALGGVYLLAAMAR